MCLTRSHCLSRVSRHSACLLLICPQPQGSVTDLNPITLWCCQLLISFINEITHHSLSSDFFHTAKCFEIIIHHYPCWCLPLGSSFQLLRVNSTVQKISSFFHLFFLECKCHLSQERPKKKEKKHTKKKKKELQYHRVGVYLTLLTTTTKKNLPNSLPKWLYHSTLLPAIYERYRACPIFGFETESWFFFFFFFYISQITHNVDFIPRHCWYILFWQVPVKVLCLFLLSYLSFFYWWVGIL